ncbi:MAG TPA: alpha/beta hydrolase, partial [Candidatus Methylacidiphilales bacterium]|nr:alpha/beta hydrolase [Candidatus Methylacidiphilales bacterium]
KAKANAKSASKELLPSVVPASKEKKSAPKSSASKLDNLKGKKPAPAQVPEPEPEEPEVTIADVELEDLPPLPPVSKVIFQKADDEASEADSDLSDFLKGAEGALSEQMLWIPSGAYRLAAVLHAAQNVSAEAVATGKFPLVIMSHGFTGNKLESGRLFATTARSIATRGLSVVRFDFMGSGDSTGEFYEMTPNTEIADLHAVIAWAQENGFGPIGLLGLSFGGAVSICTAAQAEKAEPGTIAALATWSSVPGFKFWRHSPDGSAPLPAPHTNGLQVGPEFYTDRPEVDVPESYQSLTIPKFQIQGDKDIEGFREKFAEFFKTAPKPKKHTVLKGADHVFTTWAHRLKVIDQTADWLAEHLVD